MNKKTLLITLFVLLAVLAVAGILYPRLSQEMQPQQLATVPTQPEAPVPSQTTEPTAETESAAETEAATEPEPVAMPDFTVLDWEGNEVKLSDYLGKPIVLNFWAHWCGPCASEMPEFNAVWEELEGEVTFLMVHEGAAVEEGKQKVTDGGYTFPVVFDTDSSVGNLYGITAFPTTFFVDADGYLQGWYMGAMSRDLLQMGIDLIYAPGV